MPEKSKNLVKLITILIVFILFMLVLGWYFYKKNQNPLSSGQPINSNLVTTTNNKNPKKLNLTKVIIAKTSYEQAKGLMDRQEMCQECGMLFEFSQDEKLSFWMKNTYISLDMIFVNSQNQIVNIEKNTKPLQEYPNYTSNSPAKYVIEVNGGFADKNELKNGDFVDIDFLKTLKTTDF